VSRSFSQLRRLTSEEWRRPIGPAAYARGVSCCLENARNLVDDSLSLFGARSNARAVVLAVLALEEGDKIKRLMRVALLTDPKAIEREWVAFRNHKPKLSSALSLLTHGELSMLNDRLPPKKKRFPAGAEWMADVPRLTQRLKLRCLYVTRLRDGTWTLPSKMVPRLMARVMIGGALHFFSITTTLVLGIDMLIGGQLEETPEWKRPDFSESTLRAQRWLRWRLGRVGQRWGQRELARHLEWLNKTEERSRELFGRQSG
jgi:AbiV family abortive infection protein